MDPSKFSRRQFMALSASAASMEFDNGITDGYVDDGWEDTVLIMPNERVRLLMRFKDYAGYYAYQCHMLEHAADGLMRNYLIEK